MREIGLKASVNGFAQRIVIPLWQVVEPQIFVQKLNKDQMFRLDRITGCTGLLANSRNLMRDDTIGSNSDPLIISSISFWKIYCNKKRVRYSYKTGKSSRHFVTWMYRNHSDENWVTCTIHSKIIFAPKFQFRCFYKHLDVLEYLELKELY